jgi:hypothetical protein
MNSIRPAESLEAKISLPETHLNKRAGKTKSALRLAAGLSPDKPAYVIHTESSRSRFCQELAPSGFLAVHDGCR